MKKGILSFVLVCCMMLTLVPTAAFAVESKSAKSAIDIWDGSIANGFASGNGTKDDPYIIETAAQLAFLSTIEMGQSGQYYGKYYRLVNDIYLNDVSGWENWDQQAPSNVWSPIGSFKGHFNGFFDGEGHVISGVYINSSEDYQGLFAGICHGGIKNLGIVDSYIKGNDYVGGLAGQKRSHSSFDKIEIENCYFAGNVFGNSNVGGIVGYNYEIDSAMIENCQNFGSINGVSNVGGIAGYNLGFSTGRIECCYNNGPVTGTSFVGGIVGYNTCSYAASSYIRYCYNAGTVKGNASVGGIAGSNQSTSITLATVWVENCYNIGTVNGNYYTGGIIGYNRSAKGSSSSCGAYLKNSYNVGTVHGKYYNAGGVVGYNSDGTAFINNCYYLRGCAVDGYDVEQGGVGCNSSGSVAEDKNGVTKKLSDEEMQKQESFAGFDFDTVWVMPSEGAYRYPIFTNNIQDNQYLDTDGDGLLDIWEINGVDTDGDGTIDLPLNEMGADPNRPDIFVEIDWMVRPPKQWLWVEINSETFLGPTEQQLKMVYNAFLAHNINLHLDAGPSSVDFVTGKLWGNLSGGNQIIYKEKLDLSTEWASTIKANFDSSRFSVFRYAIFIDQYIGFDGKATTSSGIANNIPGQFLLVANQDWVRRGGDIAVAGTFMHELGHTLGLRHGGCDHTHYKPNYLSIMNYLFQTTGLVGTNQIDYSNYELDFIDERNLYEAEGVDIYSQTQGTNLGTAWYYNGKKQYISNIAGAEIDYNLNGQIENRISVDLNNDRILSSYESYNDWENIIYKGGGIGTPSSDSTGVVFDYDSTIQEKTLDDAIKTDTLSMPGGGSVDFVGPYTLIANQTNQKLYLNIENRTNNAVDFILAISSSSITQAIELPVHVEGANSEISVTKVEIPVNDKLASGNYILKYTLNFNDTEVFSDSIELTAYEPTQTDIEQCINNVDSVDINLDIKSQYIRLLNSVSIVPTTGVLLNKTEITLSSVGSSETLTATVVPNDATDKSVAWTSSDETVATVNEAGVVTAIGCGTAIITATTNDGGYTATCEVTVTAGPDPIEPSITIKTQPQDLNVVEGSTGNYLSVEAETTGEEELLYQWYTCDDGDGSNSQILDGETRNIFYLPSYTLPADLDSNTYYYFCEVSTATIDAVETNVASVTVTKAGGEDSHVHNWATEWSSDSTQHWHICLTEEDPCGERKDVGEHVYDNDSDDTCDICGYLRTVVPPILNYTITFDANGGTVTPANVVTNNDGRLPVLPVPARRGYIFNGWYTSANAGTQITTNTIFEADTTVYAQWSIQNIPGSGSSGGSGASGYSIAIPKIDNGSISVSPKSAKSGDTVTITVKPDVGYELDSLTVTDKNGDAVKLTKKSNTQYTFVMPASNVNMEASFVKIIDSSESLPFTDVAANAYYYDAVKWAAAEGITGGTTSTTFSPNAPCTRAQIVTFLWRAAGSPEPENLSDFSDVSADAYYAKAVAWALENGITGGTGNGMFSPDTTCTRSQSMTFLYRAAGSPTASEDIAFGDVTAESYYADAVAWAAQNGITSGIGNGLFGPANECSRAQIVTFLYRWLVK